MQEIVTGHPLKVLSALVCVMLVAGVLNRRRRHIHIPLMVSSFLIDLGIVLYLEIRRGVVESIPGRPMTPLLIVHITLSTIVLVFYGVQIYTGIQNAKGNRRPWHRTGAVAFLITRFGNLITSFMIT